MMLYLMRHAEAGEADRRRWPDDRMRPVSARGHREHALVSRTLRRMGVRFDRLLTSPLVRARQTAEITARAYGGRIVPEETDALGDEARLKDLLRALRRLPRDTSVVAVGHEPFLSKAVAALISPDGSARVQIRKSGVAALEFEGRAKKGRGTLLFHLRPREMAALAGRA
jgi:phosphohistidine phosphatase